VLREAKRSATITDNNPEEIKAAQAVALEVFLARQGNTKDQIRASLKDHFGYDLDRTIEDVRPGYRFDVSAQKSVPEAIIAFLDLHDFDTAIRNAIWLGDDADTQACMAGALAEAHYGAVPARIASDVRKRLPVGIPSVVDAFDSMTT